MSTMSKVIEPTVGRIVWFYAPSDFEKKPRAAIVAWVHSERMVNLCVIQPEGGTVGVTSVRLIQPGDDEPVGLNSYATWMPYQLGQAARAEAAEAKLQP